MNSPIKYWAKDLSRHFIKENTRIAYINMIKWSVQLVIREMEKKTTRRYYYLPTKLAKIKKTAHNATSAEDVE